MEYRRARRTEGAPAGLCCLDESTGSFGPLKKTSSNPLGMLSPGEECDFFCRATGVREKLKHVLACTQITAAVIRLGHPDGRCIHPVSKKKLYETYSF